jgi:heme/copper-type cytochrome/quinol oxidase subunit 2
MATDQNAYAATTPPAYDTRVDAARGSYGGSAASGRNGMGTAALVLGIVAILTSWLWFVGPVLAVLAIIFGFMGRGRANRGEATNRSSATAGLVTGIVSLVLTGALLVVGIAVLQTSTGKCVQNAKGNQAAAQQCLNK